MGSSSQGRAISFPFSWAGERSRNGTTAQPCELTDEQIVAGLQAGDSSFLYVLFGRYSLLVLDVALHVLRDRGEAEEIVQEVFFYVYRKANLFDPSKGLAKAWIIQLAYHRSLDRRSYLGRHGFYAGTEIDSLDDSLLGTTDLEREVGAKLSRAQLEKAFRQLPEMQRRSNAGAID